MKKLTVTLLAVLLIGVSAPTMTAQCIGDDGFSIPGACCVVNPALNLPTALPALSIPSESCCFYNCQVEAVDPVSINIGQPIPLFCDTWVALISVTGGSVSIPPTYMIMKYQRTWEESDPTGLNRQVWRFLINVDMTYLPTATSVSPCPTPACAGAVAGATGLPVHYIGHLDYAISCGGFSAWESAISLTHMCGPLMHGPYSARPIAGSASHPDRTYCFAGPTPFAWGITAPPVGPTIADAQRSTNINLGAFPFIFDCYSETPAGTQGSINTVFNNCLCYTPSPLVGPAPLWHHQNIVFDYGCGAAGVGPYVFTPIPVPPLLPTGIATMSLGTYLGGANGGYPAGESVNVYIGAAAAPDPCPATSAFVPPFHIVTGVGTTGGDLAVLFPNALGIATTTTSFVDLQNILLFNPTSPTGLSIGLGSIFFSTQVWQLNAP